ncbi:hypothetical protein BUALT_Bualt02G0059800 [Buddleja alternifolia]|uniref:Protein kinase domain-containing protein n=1 Tax=Buddleja alternifolia TaxID=168488 RepID=A0AAV6Y8Z9_9LAMI|nr:hypothetical protein BUALT_Bualt02G0059800 [Buddleja alternifolia]
MHRLKLSENMRAKADPSFGDFLLRVGRGTEPTDKEGNIKIPEDMVINYDENDEDASEQKLIDIIFPSLQEYAHCSTYLTKRAILASKNENVDKLNEKIIQSFPGMPRTFTSFDEAGTKIHGIIFTNALQLFESKLIIHKTYVISSPTIRETNKKYPNVNPKIELVLQATTTVTEAQESINCRNISLVFSDFNELKTDSDVNELFDVIGFVKKIKQPFQFSRNDNTIGHRREVVLMNHKFDTITINLWDDMAIVEGQWLQKIVADKPIVTFSGLKRQLYQGDIQMASMSTTSIILNPSSPETKILSSRLTGTQEDKNIEQLWMAKKIKESKEVTLKQLINDRAALLEDGEVSQTHNQVRFCQRVKIAFGAAKGLEYLHEKAQPPSIHGDFQSSNVMISDDDVAKITDFELSNQAFYTETRLDSFRVLVTFGYQCPDFGVVLLELLTGLKPVDHTRPRGQQSLVTWKTAIAALCLQYKADFCLNMSIVVKALLQPSLNARSVPPTVIGPMLQQSLSALVSQKKIDVK